MEDDMKADEFTKIREKVVGNDRKRLAKKLGIEVVLIWSYEGGGVSIPKAIEKQMIALKGKP